MSAHVTIAQATGDELRIELRQWRLTTLTESNQLALADAVARCLGVRVARVDTIV
jgi:hypothetical protein